MTRTVLGSGNTGRYGENTSKESPLNLDFLLVRPTSDDHHHDHHPDHDDDHADRQGGGEGKDFRERLGISAESNLPPLKRHLRLNLDTK